MSYKITYKSRRAGKEMSVIVCGNINGSFFIDGDKKERTFKITDRDSYGRFDELISCTYNDANYRRSNTTRSNLGKIVSIVGIGSDAGRIIPFKANV